MDRQYSHFYDFDFKSLDETGTFDGYASTFGNTDLQGDVVMPGAFEKTLKRSAGKVPIFNVHRSWEMVGLGLGAAEDDKGLKVTGQFTLGRTDGQNAYASLKHAQEIGYKLGLSIGYMVDKGGAEFDDAASVRKLKSLELMEYSIAPIPANSRARVSRVKSQWTIREFEEYLRDGGFSVAAAKAIAASGFGAIDQREVDDAAAVAEKRANDAMMATFGQHFLVQSMKAM